MLLRYVDRVLFDYSKFVSRFPIYLASLLLTLYLPAYLDTRKVEYRTNPPRNENTKVRELLRYYKERTKGKRVAIKGKFVLNTREILEVVEKAEAEASTKTSKKKRRTKSLIPDIEGIEEDVLEIVSEELEGDCIIVASRR